MDIIFNGEHTNQTLEEQNTNLIMNIHFMRIYFIEEKSTIDGLVPTPRTATQTPYFRSKKLLFSLHFTLSSTVINHDHSLDMETRTGHYQTLCLP